MNKAVTSQDVIHSPSSSLVFLTSSTNSFVLLTWWMVLPTRGLRILASPFAIPICYRANVLIQWDLEEYLSNKFLEAHKTWENMPLWDDIFL